LPVFNHYAHYYDLLYKDKNYAAEADYVENLIKTYNPKSQSILELGCGSGQHALRLAKKGYFVHGIDQSKDMLNKAFIHLDDSLPLSFLQADIRSYEDNKKYDVVISLFHVMSYQTTNGDLLASFMTAKKHLKSGGIFIFDCWYGPAVLTDAPVERRKHMDNEIVSVFRKAVPTLYPNKNCVEVHYTVFVTEKATGKSEEIQETHKMRYFFQPEIELILTTTGFSLLKAEKWITGQALTAQSWNACFIVRG